jgi:hypothetical protein
MRKARPWLVAVVVVGAVAGCTSDEAGAPGPTITSTYEPPTQSTRPASSSPVPPPVSTGPNVRPGEKPPTLDPVGRTNTNAGALAFGDYWMRTLEWGYATTDSTLAKSVFSRACGDCARFVKIFDTARDDGVHFRGGRTAVLRSLLQPNDHHNGATAVDDITVSIGALQAIDSRGRVVESDPAHPRVVYRVWLRWRADSWTVVETKQGAPR